MTRQKVKKNEEKEEMNKWKSKVKKTKREKSNRRDHRNVSYHDSEKSDLFIDDTFSLSRVSCRVLDVRIVITL